LIALTHPVELEYPDDSRSSDQWRNVSIDQRGTLYHSFGTRQRLHYVVRSVVTSRSDLVETDTGIPRQTRQFYLNTPRNTTPRMRALAADVTRDTTSFLGRARAIESYLRNNYAYTLELPRRGANPIDNFLFEDKRGHCEFFSTAMVLMLREAGVPARNVNGFQGGEWNDVGGYYIVRRMHAHSWVEAWIPGEGWITFDPTPAAGLPTTRAEESPGFFG